MVCHCIAAFYSVLHLLSAHCTSNKFKRHHTIIKTIIFIIVILVAGCFCFAVNYLSFTLQIGLPVLKLTTISIKKIVSLKQLNAIHRVLKSSLKNDIATGRIIKLATNSSSIHKSQ